MSETMFPRKISPTASAVQIDEVGINFEDTMLDWTRAVHIADASNAPGANYDVPTFELKVPGAICVMTNSASSGDVTLLVRTGIGAGFLSTYSIIGKSHDGNNPASQMILSSILKSNITFLVFPNKASKFTAWSYYFVPTLSSVDIAANLNNYITKLSTTATKNINFETHLANIQYPFV